MGSFSKCNRKTPPIYNIDSSVEMTIITSLATLDEVSSLGALEIEINAKMHAHTHADKWPIDISNQMKKKSEKNWNIVEKRVSVWLNELNQQKRQRRKARKKENQTTLTLFWATLVSRLVDHFVTDFMRSMIRALPHISVRLMRMCLAVQVCKFNWSVATFVEFNHAQRVWVCIWNASVWRWIKISFEQKSVWK